MKVLITGGAGYIGYALVAGLNKYLGRSDEIIIYDNLSRKHYGIFTHDKFSVKVSFEEGDILDDRKLDKVLKGTDVVVHLAARVTTPYADHDAHAFDQVNHWGTAALVNAVERSAVQKFINLSSISVYGSTRELVNEDSPTAPHSHYGISKLQAEKQVSRLADNIPYWIIRSGNVYGYVPTFRLDAVINKFMFHAHFHGRISINGDGKQMRSFIHIDKIADILVKVVAGDIKPGLYNASEHNLSIRELAHTIGELYPHLEILSINQHLSMKQIQIESPGKLSKQIAFSKVSLLEELKELKNSFAF